MNDEPGRIWTEVLVASSRCYPEILLVAKGKTMKNLSQDRQCLGQDSNQTIS
jgi:hypothetical protein